MLGRLHLPRIPAMMWAFSACCAPLPLACSDGHSGLVLSRPAVSGGAGTGGSSGSGGTEPTPVGGQSGELGTAGGASVDQSGAGGEGGAPPGDGWVEELCTPLVTFENQSPMGDGKVFDEAVGSPAELLWSATRAACRTLFRSASEVPSVPEIALTIGAFEGGVAGTGDGLIIISDAYLKSQADAGADLLREITGILYFQSSFLYQNPGRTGESDATRWVRYGIADFVRLRGGYLTRASRAPAVDGWAAAGSQSVAYFFDFLREENADVVYALNQRLAPTEEPWSDDTFLTLMGRDLPTLWEEYRGTF